MLLVEQIMLPLESYKKIHSYVRICNNYKDTYLYTVNMLTISFANICCSGKLHPLIPIATLKLKKKVLLLLKA